MELNHIDQLGEAGGKVYQFFGGGKRNQYGSDPAELAYNAALAQAENEKSNALKNSRRSTKHVFK